MLGNSNIVSVRIARWFRVQNPDAGQICKLGHAYITAMIGKIEYGITLIDIAFNPSARNSPSSKTASNTCSAPSPLWQAAGNFF
jgi:hypothetical protein